MLFTHISLSGYFYYHRSSIINCQIAFFCLVFILDPVLGTGTLTTGTTSLYESMNRLISKLQVLML